MASVSIQAVKVQSSVSGKLLYADLQKFRFNEKPLQIVASADELLNFFD